MRGKGRGGELGTRRPLSEGSNRRMEMVWLFGRSRFLEPPVLQHRLSIGWRAAPVLVHFGEVLGISPREDHLAKAIAVCAGKYAVIVEPLVAVVSEHLGKQIGVVA